MYGSAEEADSRSTLIMFTTRLGLDITDAIVQKALKLIAKGLSLTHVLSEVLLYVYLRSNGYDNISIEETVGITKCDVYARQGLNDMCIEIETNIIPTDYVLEGYKYIVAKHIKKLIQTSKDGISLTSFAYPFGVVPLIPLELLKNPGSRSKEAIEKLFNIAGEFFNLNIDDIPYLEKCIVGDLYVFDIASQKVLRIPKSSIQKLLVAYIEALGYNIIYIVP